MDPTRLSAIPANARVDIASPTVFGAKQVQFVFPENPSPESLRAGQVIDAQHVMIEVNTVFEQLTSVLSTIEPAKLNETLGAIASALCGRGEKIGQMLSDLDSYLATLEPSLPALSHDLEVAPGVLRAYADASTDFVSIADNAARISDTHRRPATEPRCGARQRDRPGRHRQLRWSDRTGSRWPKFYVCWCRPPT